jgi:hypothetical protein
MDIWLVDAGACVWFLSTFIIGDAMNEIYLIIDALESAYEDKAGWCDKVNEALYAARRLQALQPVGVFEYDAENQVWEELTPNCEGVKLYALDEVTK